MLPSHFFFLTSSVTSRLQTVTLNENKTDNLSHGYGMDMVVHDLVLKDKLTCQEAARL